MATNKGTNYRYFLFSKEQIADKNAAYDKVNRKMVLGTVIYNGQTKEYSCLSVTPELPRYTDERIVAEGDITKMKYTLPSTKPKRSNEE